jgi:hypothetical protein
VPLRPNICTATTGRTTGNGGLYAMRLLSLQHVQSLQLESAKSFVVGLAVGTGAQS